MYNAHTHTHIYIYIYIYILANHAITDTPPPKQENQITNNTAINLPNVNRQYTNPN